MKLKIITKTDAYYFIINSCLQDYSNSEDCAIAFITELIDLATGKIKREQTSLEEILIHRGMTTPFKIVEDTPTTKILYSKEESNL